MPELRPRTKVQASALLASELTAGLAGFYPRLALVGAHGSGQTAWNERLRRLGKASTPLLRTMQIPDDESGQALTRLYEYGDEGMDQFITGYPMCCRQLFNHIIDEAPIRVCSNPTCGQLYSRGHRRDGSRRLRESAYCSDSCADVVRKRRSRQRQSSA
jgi:hypothetical protein